MIDSYWFGEFFTNAFLKTRQSQLLQSIENDQCDKNRTTVTLKPSLPTTKDCNRTKSSHV